MFGGGKCERKPVHEAFSIALVRDTTGVNPGPDKCHKQKKLPLDVFSAALC